MCIVFIPYFALTFLKVPPRSASVPKPIIPKPTPTLQPRTVPQRIAHQPTPRSTPQTTTRSTPQVTQRSTPQSTPKQTTPQLAPKRTSPAKQPTISTAKQPVRAISASAPTKATVKPTAKLVRKNIHRKVLRNYAKLNYHSKFIVLPQKRWKLWMCLQSDWKKYANTYLHLPFSHCQYNACNCIWWACFQMFL